MSATIALGWLTPRKQLGKNCRHGGTFVDRDGVAQSQSGQI
jgi:hypothetical protein